MNALQRTLAVVAAAPGACTLTGASALAALAGADWMRAVLLMVAVAMGGCAALPDSEPLPASHAIAADSDSALARIAAASRRGAPRELSGFRLLATGDEAFRARIALIRRAEKSIDAQYYLISADRSGHAFLRELRAAAGRGVRVRVLVDDLNESGQDGVIAGFAAHEHVELRLFNPLPARGGGTARRVAFSLHELARVNHRMHNKLLVVDNAMAIGGGRNIADLYFERGGPAGFIDVDVLATGPVVAELSTVFDGYWNSRYAYAIEALAGRAEDAVSGRRLCDTVLDADAADDSGDDNARDAGRTGAGIVAELAEGHIHQHLARVRVLADDPGKVDDGNDDAEGFVMREVLGLVATAETEVLIASPYVVPGRRGIEAIAGSTARGVRVSVLTNSLAATDEPLVHFGYMRYREALLGLGVGLYELMPSTAPRGTEARPSFASSSRLHAKVVVVDERRVFIGSMNMDRRSSRLNTELGLVIDSAGLAGEVAALLRAEQTGRSYRLRLGSGPHRLEW
ncbi:MAG: phospholipase D family protein, partial [Caldimonas sp.]